MAGMNGNGISQFSTSGVTSDRPVAVPRGWDGAAEGQKQVKDPIDAQVMADAEGTRFVNEGHPAVPEVERPQRHWLRYSLIAVVVACIVAAATYWGVPYVKEAWVTVSTDDAFVTSHITNVSPRIEDLVTEVLVDQDDRVAPGTLLLKLDRIPFELAASQSRATLDQEKAALVDARAKVRGQLEQARSSWHRRRGAQEQLRRQVASLRAQVAALRARESSLQLAEIDRQRIDNLVKRGSATQSELDTRNNTRDVNREQVKEAWAAIQETRAALGLEPDYNDPLKVPENFERQQSSVQTAVAETSGLLAQIGIAFDPKDLESAESFEKFLKQGDLGQTDRIVENAPAVAEAKAEVVKAERDLDNSLLRLSYTEIRSEIAGYVEDRSVHPGNRVEPGQTLLSIRPDHVWVDANFKETQLNDIKIGMPVDLDVDAYPGKVFKGRVAGFSPGTGLAASLLPPQNATGNYVKVTQRLPVRIELIEPASAETPLFAGLSVVPRVRYKEKATGPAAGKRLREPGRAMPPDVGSGPAGSQARIRLEGGPGRS